MKYPGFVLVLLMLTNCLNKPDCIITATNQVKIGFVNASNQPRQTQVDSIRVLGKEALYYKGVSVSTVNLPISPEVAEALFVFYYEQHQDTVRLQYKVEPQIISPDCGAYTIYKNLSVTETSFEFYQVVTSQLSTNATVNLQLRIE